MNDECLIPIIGHNTSAAGAAGINTTLGCALGCPPNCHGMAACRNSTCECYVAPYLLYSCSSPHKVCSGRGSFVNGTCYCHPGSYGVQCEEQYSPAIPLEQRVHFSTQVMHTM